MLHLFSSTKGDVSVIKTSCAHSVTLKRINKTHLFMHFHIVIWTRELLWKYLSCLSKLLLHELWPKQLRERFIIVTKLYIFLLKKPDNYLRRSYIYIQLVIQCYTICILDVHIHRRVNLVPSPPCMCGTEDQTTEYIWQICPSYQHLREQIWSDGTSLHQELYGKKEELERTIGFIQQTGLSV